MDSPFRPSERNGRFLTEALFVAILLIVYVGLALSAIQDKSATYDEGIYLTGGYSYWARNDYRLNSFSGHFSQRWAALPLVLRQAAFPDQNHPCWKDPVDNEYSMAMDFLYHVGNDPESLLWQGRCAIVLFSALLGVVVYLWSRRLFGPWGGVLSLTLFVLCPTMLANGPVVQSDMSAALFFALATAGVWGLLQRVGWLQLVASCFAVAGLFLAKLTAVLFVPLAALLLLVRLACGGAVPLGQCGLVHGRGRQLALFAVLALVHVGMVGATIWAAHGFRFSPFNDNFVQGPDYFQRELDRCAVEAGLPGQVFQWMHRRRVLPEAYLFGLTYQSWKVHQGRASFFNGELRMDAGFFWFFPYCLLVKTPLPLFVLLGLAGWALVRTRRAYGLMQGERPDATVSLYALTPILALLGVYGLGVLTSRQNIGHRYLIPAYPPLFILAGANALWGQWQRTRDLLAACAAVSRNGRGIPSVVVVLLALFALESVSVRPHYLAYFNLLAGGSRNGYRHLVDSSLDWGQDLSGLKAWLDARCLPSSAEPVYLAYFGTAKVEHYGIKATQLKSTPRQEWSAHRATRPGGFYCISATLLQLAEPWTSDAETRYRRLRALLLRYRRTAKDEEARAALFKQVPADRWPQLHAAYNRAQFNRLCSALRSREPDDQVGYSILIYHLSDEDVRAMLRPSS